MYSNNILNFHESTTILNACKKKSGTLLKAPRNKLNPEQRQSLLTAVVTLPVDIVDINVDIKHRKTWKRKTLSGKCERSIPGE